MDVIVPYQPLGYEWEVHVENDVPWLYVNGQRKRPVEPGEEFYHTVQEDFYESKAFTPAFIGAARAGKTMCGAGKAFSNLLSSGTNVLAVAPRWDQVRGVMVEEYLKVIPKELVWPTADGGIFHETQKIIRILDLKALAERRREPGPVIYFRSGEDPKAIYGFTVGTVHLDEAPQMVEEAFGASVERCSQKPNQLFATFTPKGGRQNWANRKWGLGYTEEVPGAPSPWSPRGKLGWRIINPDPESPSWLMDYTHNYTLPQAWRDMMEANVGLESLYGQQELLGRVVDFAGLVYEEYDPKIHVRPSPLQLTRVVGGIDRALGGVTAIGLVGMDIARRVHVFREWGKRGAILEDILLACRAMQHEYPGLIFHADPSPGGEAELRTLQANGVRVVSAHKEMDFGVKLIQQYLHVRADGLPGMFVDPSCPYTNAQFQSWAYKEGVVGGMITHDKVERHGKDYIDAVRYAMVGLLAPASSVFDLPKLKWTVRGKPVGVR